MDPLDRAAITNILSHLCEHHEGEWLLVGGAAVALWLDDRRVTQDVDLVPMQDSSKLRYALLDTAHTLGLPIEVVNSAADFFVRRIADWQDGIVELMRGRRGVVYRPNSTLLVLTKLSRLSELDLEDCRAAIATKDGLDRDRVLRALDALSSSAEPELEKRRAALRQHVSG